MKINIRENIKALQQGERLLGQLSDAAYNHPVQQVFQSTVGTHIRHNIDHYACFLSGLESGRIDYAARQRDRRVEQDRLYAITEMSNLRMRLERVTEVWNGLRLQVVTDVGPGHASTSIKRELEFLLSHTTHHYALMAIICRLQGIDVESDFGIAPSTLRHRTRQVA